MTFTPRKCQAKNGAASCIAGDCPEKQDYKSLTIELAQTENYTEYSRIRDMIMKMEEGNPLLSTQARIQPTYTAVQDLKPGTVLGTGTVVSVYHRHPQPRNKRTVILETKDGKKVAKEWGAHTKISHFPEYTRKADAQQTSNA